MSHKDLKFLLGTFSFLYYNVLIHTQLCALNTLGL